MPSHIATKITYFNSIPVIPEKKSIMSRLGHSRPSNVLGLKDAALIDETIGLGLALCRNQGVAGRFGIKTQTVGSVVLNDGVSLESRQLARMLQKSDGVILMAGSAGPEITSRITSEMENGNSAAAVMLDAVASVSADMILDWIMDLFNKMLKKEGRRLTRHRYSPGFGDLALDNQAVIFRLLDLERLHLSLSDSMMLSPEKSVLAIAGTERIKAE